MDDFTNRSYFLLMTQYTIQIGPMECYCMLGISLAYFKAQIKFDATKTDLKLNQQ